MNAFIVRYLCFVLFPFLEEVAEEASGASSLSGNGDSPSSHYPSIRLRLHLRHALWWLCVVYWAAAIWAVALRELSAAFSAVTVYGGRHVNSAIAKDLSAHSGDSDSSSSDGGGAVSANSTAKATANEGKAEGAAPSPLSSAEKSQNESKGQSGNSGTATSGGAKEKEEGDSAAPVVAGNSAGAASESPAAASGLQQPSLSLLAVVLAPLQQARMQRRTAFAMFYVTGIASTLTMMALLFAAQHYWHYTIATGYGAAVVGSLSPAATTTATTASSALSAAPAVVLSQCLLPTPFQQGLMNQHGLWHIYGQAPAVPLGPRPTSGGGGGGEWATEASILRLMLTLHHDGDDSFSTRGVDSSVVDASGGEQKVTASTGGLNNATGGRRKGSGSRHQRAHEKQKKTAAVSPSSSSSSPPSYAALLASIPSPSVLVPLVACGPLALFLMHCCVRLLETFYIHQYRDDGSDTVTVFAMVSGCTFYAFAALSLFVGCLELFVAVVQGLLAVLQSMLVTVAGAVAAERGGGGGGGGGGGEGMASAALNSDASPLFGFSFAAFSGESSTSTSSPSLALLSTFLTHASTAGPFLLLIGVVVFTFSLLHCMLQLLQVGHHYILGQLQARRRREKRRMLDAYYKAVGLMSDDAVKGRRGDATTTKRKKGEASLSKDEGRDGSSTTPSAPRSHQRAASASATPLRGASVGEKPSALASPPKRASIAESAGSGSVASTKRGAHRRLSNSSSSQVMRVADYYDDDDEEEEDEEEEGNGSTALPSPARSDATAKKKRSSSTSAVTRKRNKRLSLSTNDSSPQRSRSPLLVHGDHTDGHQHAVDPEGCEGTAPDDDALIPFSPSFVSSDDEKDNADAATAGDAMKKEAPPAADEALPSGDTACIADDAFGAVVESASTTPTTVRALARHHHMKMGGTTATTAAPEEDVWEVETGSATTASPFSPMPRVGGSGPIRSLLSALERTQEEEGGGGIGRGEGDAERPMAGASAPQPPASSIGVAPMAAAADGAVIRSATMTLGISNSTSSGAAIDASPAYSSVARSATKRRAAANRRRANTTSALGPATAHHPMPNGGGTVAHEAHDEEEEDNPKCFTLKDRRRSSLRRIEREAASASMGGGGGPSISAIGGSSSSGGGGGLIATLSGGIRAAIRGSTPTTPPHPSSQSTPSATDASLSSPLHLRGGRGASGTPSPPISPPPASGATPTASTSTPATGSPNPHNLRDDASALLLLNARQLEPPYTFPKAQGLFTYVLEPHYGLEVLQYACCCFFLATLLLLGDGMAHHGVDAVMQHHGRQQHATEARRRREAEAERYTQQHQRGTRSRSRSSSRSPSPAAASSSSLPSGRVTAARRGPTLVSSPSKTVGMGGHDHTYDDTNSNAANAAPLKSFVLLPEPLWGGDYALTVYGPRAAAEGGMGWWGDGDGGAGREESERSGASTVPSEQHNRRRRFVPAMLEVVCEAIITNPFLVPLGISNNALLCSQVFLQPFLASALSLLHAVLPTVLLGLFSLVNLNATAREHRAFWRRMLVDVPRWNLIPFVF